MARPILRARLLGLLCTAGLAGTVGLGALRAAAAPASASVSAARGAPVAFQEYEAEAGATNGSIVGPGRTAGTLAAEASGRKAVRLPAAGYFVELTLRAPANSIDLRYSIPDSANGAGTSSSLAVMVAGKVVVDLPLTSAYTWFYGAYPYTNNPSDGSAHHFYDDTRALLGRTLPAGTKVRLVARSATVVDVADFEEVGAPLTQPAGSLSVVDFGADPTGAKDSGEAFQNAIYAGAAQHKPVWIPTGTFTVGRHLLVDKVTLQGAGPWYSVLQGNGVGIFGKAAPTPSTDVHLADFALFGEVKDRVDGLPLNGIGGALGGGSTISDLWIQHEKVGMWLDGPFDGLTITGCRIQDTTADGINLHQGVSHVTIEKTFVRNTGDDGLALWSEEGRLGAAGADHDDVLRFDTVELPILANGVAFYGGHDNSVTDSVVQDTVIDGGGIHVGARFQSTPLGGTTTIARDTLVRAGAYQTTTSSPGGALWFWAQQDALTGKVVVSDTVLKDSTYSAVQFVGGTVTGVRLVHDTIDHPGTFGVQIQANGGMAVAGVTAKNVGARKGTFYCPTANKFRIAGSIKGLRGLYCGAFPKPRN
jgi:hypothetical protein